MCLIVSKDMADILTPDEDAVLGEVTGTKNLKVSQKRIHAIAKRCNISVERASKALAGLHDKGIIFLQMPGKKNIKKIQFTCDRCGTVNEIVIDSAVKYVACSKCYYEDGVKVMRDVTLELN